MRASDRRPSTHRRSSGRNTSAPASDDPATTSERHRVISPEIAAAHDEADNERRAAPMPRARRPRFRRLRALMPTRRRFRRWSGRVSAIVMLMLAFSGMLVCGSGLPGVVRAHVAHTPIDARSEATLARLGIQVRRVVVRGVDAVEMVLGPASFDDRLPLVVYIHGRADRPRVFAGDFSDLRTPVRVLMPQAGEPLGDGFTWMPVSVTEGKTERLSRTLASAGAHLAKVIRSFEGARSTLGRPIVTGFSQGGMLTFELAVHHPEVVGLALPNAGWLPPQRVPDRLAPERPYPRVRAMHGTADPIVPIGPTRRTVDRLRNLGLDVELTEIRGAEHEMNRRWRAEYHDRLEAAVRGFYAAARPLG